MPCCGLFLRVTAIQISGLVRRAYLSRGAWRWAAARLVVAALLLLTRGDPIRLPLIVSAAIVVSVCLFSYMDLKWRSETAFLHNLGISGAAIAVLSAMPAIAGESIIRIVSTVVR